jgi:hypothetical protein
MYGSFQAFSHHYRAIITECPILMNFTFLLILPIFPILTFMDGMHACKQLFCAWRDLQDSLGALHRGLLACRQEVVGI